MYNKVLWALDNDMDYKQFERLCTDLLYREGFKDIVPIGGNYDRGRDAEVTLYRGIRSQGGIVFFQYSLEEDWERKLGKEAEKVQANGHEISFFVFVTSQKVTGDRRDKWEKLIAENYKWKLIIFDREWLRHRLEEAHPDLAIKYLGIEEVHFHNLDLSQKPPAPPNTTNEIAWILYIQGDYEAAELLFKKIIKTGKNHVEIYQALAWCQYVLFQYEEALHTIEQALEFDKENPQSLIIKASILTEDGIRRGSRAAIIQGKDIFEKLTESSTQWVDFYNYGNALHALGRYEEAKGAFQKALVFDGTQAIVWKNLGTVYFHLKDHVEEIRCYDKALSIDSRLPEALASKGVTLLQVYKDAKTAIKLISKAIEYDEELYLKWQKAWYWLSRAHYELGDFLSALKQADIGLSHSPYHIDTLDLKALILSKLWREDASFIDTAISFYKFRLEAFQTDYGSIAELMHLYQAQGENTKVWRSIAEQFGFDINTLHSYTSICKHTIDDFIVGVQFLPMYRIFRESNQLSDYLNILNDGNISFDEDFLDAMFTVCAVPFGLNCAFLAKLPENKRKGGLGKLHKTVRESLQVSFPNIAVKLVKTAKTDSLEQTADGVSRIITVMHHLSLLELSRQIGWIGGFFGIRAEDLDSALVKREEQMSKWQGKIAGDTFLALNSILHIAKD